MHDVFLSYAREDQEVASAIAASLSEHGWDVFWDREIPVGRTWDDFIEKALNQSRCVIVLWSPASVKSDWVRAEAVDAAERRLLVPAIVQETVLPLRFKTTQSADLVGWSAGNRDTRGFRDLVDAVTLIAGAPSRPDPVRRGVLDPPRDEKSAPPSDATPAPSPDSTPTPRPTSAPPLVPALEPVAFVDTTPRAVERRVGWTQYLGLLVAVFSVWFVVQTVQSWLQPPPRPARDSTGTGALFGPFLNGIRWGASVFLVVAFATRLRRRRYSAARAGVYAGIGATVGAALGMALRPLVLGSSPPGPAGRLLLTAPLSTIGAGIGTLLGLAACLQWSRSRTSRVLGWMLVGMALGGAVQLLLAQDRPSTWILATQFGNSVLLFLTCAALLWGACPRSAGPERPALARQLLLFAGWCVLAGIVLPVLLAPSGPRWNTVVSSAHYALLATGVATLARPSRSGDDHRAARG